MIYGELYVLWRLPQWKSLLWSINKSNDLLLFCFCPLHGAHGSLFLADWKRNDKWIGRFLLYSCSCLHGLSFLYLATVLFHGQAGRKDQGQYSGNNVAFLKSSVIMADKVSAGWPPTSGSCLARGSDWSCLAWSSWVSQTLRRAVQFPPWAPTRATSRVLPGVGQSPFHVRPRSTGSDSPLGGPIKGPLRQQCHALGLESEVAGVGPLSSKWGQSDTNRDL